MVRLGGFMHRHKLYILVIAVVLTAVAISFQNCGKMYPNAGALKSGSIADPHNGPVNLSELIGREYFIDEPGYQCQDSSGTWVTAEYKDKVGFSDQGVLFYGDSCIKNPALYPYQSGMFGFNQELSAFLYGDRIYSMRPVVKASYEQIKGFDYFIFQTGYTCMTQMGSTIETYSDHIRFGDTDVMKIGNGCNDAVVAEPYNQNDYRFSADFEKMYYKGKVYERYRKLANSEVKGRSYYIKYNSYQCTTFGGGQITTFKLMIGFGDGTSIFRSGCNDGLTPPIAYNENAFLFNKERRFMINSNLRYEYVAQ